MRGEHNVSFITFDELSKYCGLTIEELMEKNYSQLEKMEKEMQDKAILGKIQDPAMKDAVKKFMTCFGYLCQWFSEDEICYAACRKVDMNELVEVLCACRR